MNKHWQEKLESLGAKVDAAHNVSFQGEPAALEQSLATATDLSQSRPTLVELSRLGVVDIVGPDARQFFQDQVCNDLTTLSDNNVQMNGYCSPKGRLLSLFTVYAHNDGFRLILPADVIPAFVKRLQMFVLRAEVTINVNEELICSGLMLGDENTLGLDDVAVLPELPSVVMGLAEHQGTQVIRCHDANADSDGQGLLRRYLVVATADTLFSLWQSEHVARAGYALWRWGDIKAGMPSVFAESTDQFIPQMLNMQLIDGLSFKKGCYPGQEIVARMQYLGKLKKHMKHVRAPGVKRAPSPGEVLSTDTNNNAGQVVDAIVDNDGLSMLAVMTIAAPVSEVQIDGVALQEESLPYELPQEASSCAPASQ